MQCKRSITVRRKQVTYGVVRGRSGCLLRQPYSTQSLWPTAGGHRSNPMLRGQCCATLSCLVRDPIANRLSQDPLEGDPSEGGCSLVKPMLLPSELEDATYSTSARASSRSNLCCTRKVMTPALPSQRISNVLQVVSWPLCRAECRITAEGSSLLEDPFWAPPSQRGCFSRPEVSRVQAVRGSGSNPHISVAALNPRVMGTTSGPGHECCHCLDSSLLSSRVYGLCARGSLGIGFLQEVQQSRGP
ncbi:hypothetical protein NDU88_005134 [Pleurodeles waltl]|uniref:Uncharacterized protein n=1 Tax=Pleurodeles waltl TaxID=8319 RepID=A0AAV7QJW1_PLEWA|nr:hypothetical protein NDU88_005134 [Pleurodeles waltl]